ncbi:MAG: hypothetical protein LLG00_15400, partial [Planctomycetaceae bacterium]|nr:hypothetical protein [Planctomycetaceae bacterium]
MTANSCCSPFTPREVVERPSTERSAYLKDRYLREPLTVDVEYIRLLTQSHRRTDGMEALERRAENHAFALEHLSPIIHPRDELAGNKTRFIRGAVPYANYAAGPFLREMRKEEQDAQQKHIEQGHGGGIEQSLALANEGDFRLFSGKFLISNEDYESFREICEYWEDKCMMEQGERLWKTHFAQADFIEKGWAIGLYTAPHEPCPEGRLVLDYEMALSKGYRRIIAELDERVASFQPTGIQDAAKLHFWRAAKRAL